MTKALQGSPSMPCAAATPLAFPVQRLQECLVLPLRPPVLLCEVSQSPLQELNALRSKVPARTTTLRKARSTDRCNSAVREFTAAVAGSVWRASALIRICMPMTEGHLATATNSWYAPRLYGSLLLGCAWYLLTTAYCYTWLCWARASYASCLSFNMCLCVCAPPIVLCDSTVTGSSNLGHGQCSHLCAACSPALVNRCTLINCSRRSAVLDTVSCKHLLIRDARHVLKPWYDDASTASAEQETPVRTATDLLLKTGAGTVSGLSFVEAVGPVHAQVSCHSCPLLHCPMVCLGDDIGAS